MRAWNRRRRKQNRSYFSAQMKRHRKRHPDKERARNLIHKATSRGKLKRPRQCEKCGKRCKPEAHHKNYSKPYQVTWLCRTCHLAEGSKKART